MRDVAEGMKEGCVTKRACEIAGHLKVVSGSERKKTSGRRESVEWENCKDGKWTIIGTEETKKTTCALNVKSGMLETFMTANCELFSFKKAANFRPNVGNEVPVERSKTPEKGLTAKSRQLNSLHLSTSTIWQSKQYNKHQLRACESATPLSTSTCTPVHQKPSNISIFHPKNHRFFTTMGQELHTIFKHSKLVQVARPLRQSLRGSSPAPTHQIIYTPKSLAVRLNFGIKTSLPKQIGYLHIVYNDIDNPRSMPDVEKYSGKMYNRMKFQESGLVLRQHYAKTNPLFPSENTKSGSEASDATGILAGFNLGNGSSIADVKTALEANPQLYANFQQWLVKNSPRHVISAVSADTRKLFQQFLRENASVAKKEAKMADLTRSGGSHSIQGTGGFSYSQKGRLLNSPNGVKYGVVLPGRMVDDREAAIGGFVASVNDRTTLLQHNYAKNYPGKHLRQFVMPFKVNEAEMSLTGRVKIYADGVKVGAWMKRTGSSEFERSYEAAHPSFGNAGERNAKDNESLESLLNILGSAKR